MTEQPEPADTCRPIEIDGETIRVRGRGDFTELDREFAAEIVRAAKRKYATEHPSQPNGPGTAGQADPAPFVDRPFRSHRQTTEQPGA